MVAKVSHATLFVFDQVGDIKELCKLWNASRFAWLVWEYIWAKYRLKEKFPGGNDYRNPPGLTSKTYWGRLSFGKGIPYEHLQLAHSPFWSLCCSEELTKEERVVAQFTFDRSILPKASVRDFEEGIRQMIREGEPEIPWHGPTIVSVLQSVCAVSDPLGFGIQVTSVSANPYYDEENERYYNPKKEPEMFYGAIGEPCTST